MNDIEKTILLESIKGIQNYDNDTVIFLKETLREAIENDDQQLLQEILPAVLAVMGALSAVGAATYAADAVGITDGWYDKAVKYVDPWHYGIEGAAALLNATGVDRPDWLGGGKFDVNFFGKDPNEAEPGWLLDLITGETGDKSPEEILNYAQEASEEESNNILKKMAPEKRRETLKKEHGWTDEDVDAWEAENLGGIDAEATAEEGLTAEGDDAAAKVALEYLDQEDTEAAELDPETDERFRFVLGDPKLSQGLKSILSLEDQGVPLDKALQQLKNILISGGTQG